MHYVKCYYCGKTFDRDKEEFIKVNSRRYAHKDCSEQKEQVQTQEAKDKEALEQYIMKLFNTDFVDPLIQKQIKEFVEKYKYTYSGNHNMYCGGCPYSLCNAVCGKQL